MAGQITINYTSATLTAGAASIGVQNGHFVLAQNQALNLNGTFTFNQFKVTTSQIEFINNATGVTINGEVQVQIDAGNGDPTLTVSNFSGNATVTWPSSGSGYGELMPSQPLVLSGFINS